MSIKEYPQENNKELSTSSEKTIKLNTNTDLDENFDMDKEKIKKQLENAKNVEERVKLFSKRTDKYGLEAIAGMIPAIGDLTPAVISSCYLITEGIHVGLSRQDCLKILGYQTLDVLIGIIPIIGDIADFFFKGNKYSAKVFSKHLEKLKRAAQERGISQKEIDNMGKKEAKFIKMMNKYVDRKPKNKS